MNDSDHFRHIKWPEGCLPKLISHLSLSPLHTHTHVRVQFLPTSYISAFILTQHSWFTYNITLLFFPSSLLCWPFYPSLSIRESCASCLLFLPLCISVVLSPSLPRTDWLSDRPSQWVSGWGWKREMVCFMCIPLSSPPSIHPSDRLHPQQHQHHRSHLSGYNTTQIKAVCWPKVSACAETALKSSAKWKRHQLTRGSSNSKRRTKMYKLEHTGPKDTK